MSEHCSIGNDLYYKLAENYFDFEKKKDLPPERFNKKKYDADSGALDEHLWKCPQCAEAEYSNLGERPYLN
jgi:hypothetical protein